MGAIGCDCCEGGCFSLGCPGRYRRMLLQIGGSNPTTIEHQFIDKVQKFRSRAYPDTVTLTISGTPVIGDVVRANTRTILTVNADNIGDLPNAIAWQLNEGVYYSNHGVAQRFDPVSFPFVVSGSTLTARGQETFTPPGFSPVPSGYPCQPAQINVINQPGSTLALTLSFTTDVNPPFFNENIQALFIGFDLSTGSRTFQFDYGSTTVSYTRPSPATITALLTARDAYIASIINEITSNTLIDCDIVVSQLNNWIVFETPPHTDTVLPQLPFTHRIGNPDSTATIRSVGLDPSSFGVTAAGPCCHPIVVSKPFRLGIINTFGAAPIAGASDITDKFSREEWLVSYVRTETFNGGNIYSSTLEACPAPGQTFNDPCTFTTPLTQSTFYSHRVRRYISLAQITACVVDVAGVPSFQIRLRIEATWQTSRKILNTVVNGASYNTIPLASRLYDSAASLESGPGISHSLIADVFDKTITVPVDCPISSFVFTPTASDHVTTLLEMRFRQNNPQCCERLFTWLQNLYQPLIFAPVTLTFVNCDGI